MKEKLYAILDINNVVVDGWFALSFEEAQKDNPDKKIIELTYNGISTVKLGEIIERV